VRLYFDNNVYNRPFDDQSIQRNRMEAWAVEELLKRVAEDKVELFSSFVIELEHSRLPMAGRRTAVRALMDLAQKYIDPDTSILERGRNLQRLGLAGEDALHIAAAESAGVDYFVTCDDKLIRRARGLGSRIEVIPPVDIN
jgi:predicted nucleic acid-binding protein